MVPLILFNLAIFFASLQLLIRKKRERVGELYLSYIIFFSIGILGILSGIAHIFLADEITRKMGLISGSPFLLETAAANLAFGILGILAYWLRDHFWTATVIGNSLYSIGVLIIYIINFTNKNSPFYDISISIWFGYLFIPIFCMIFLALYLNEKKRKMIP